MVAPPEPRHEHPPREAGSCVPLLPHFDLHGDLCHLGTRCPWCLQPQENRPLEALAYSVNSLPGGADGPVPGHCQVCHHTAHRGQASFAVIHQHHFPLCPPMRLSYVSEQEIWPLVTYGTLHIL